MVGEYKRAAGLTRPTIVHTALELLDEVGLEGLTVRRPAAARGVQSPALYWHFRSKQQLLDQMADAIIQAAGMGPPHHGESWQDWLALAARPPPRPPAVPARPPAGPPAWSQAPSG